MGETQVTDSISIIHLLITAAAGAGGVAVSYGALRAKVAAQQEDINDLERRQGLIMGNGNPDGPIFVRRSECDRHTRAISTTLSDMQRQVGQVRNFARWYLLTKENMPPTEVEKIINGGSGG